VRFFFRLGEHCCRRRGNTRQASVDAFNWQSVSIGFPIVEQNAVDKLRQLRPGELEFYSEYLDIVRFPSEKTSSDLP